MDPSQTQHRLQTLDSSLRLITSSNQSLNSLSTMVTYSTLLSLVFYQTWLYHRSLQHSMLWMRQIHLEPHQRTPTTTTYLTAPFIELSANYNDHHIGPKTGGNQDKDIGNVSAPDSWGYHTNMKVMLVKNPSECTVTLSKFIRNTVSDIEEIYIPTFSYTLWDIFSHESILLEITTTFCVDTPDAISLMATKPINGKHSDYSQSQW